MDVVRDQEEPLTPRVPFFLRPELNTTTFCIVGFENPIDIDALKSFISVSPMLQLPRFCSLIDLNPKNGNVRGWKRVPNVDMDRHVIAVPEDLTVDGQISEGDAVNQYVADLSVNRGMPLDKPLWEIHVLLAHRCMVMWSHHVVGDGMSFMSLLQVCFGTKTHEKEKPDAPPKKKIEKKRGGKWMLEKVGSFWFDIKYVSEAVFKTFFFGDRNAIHSGAGSEIWPKKLVNAVFLIEDMNLVKRAVPNATINDVFFTVVSCGIARYLEKQSDKGLKKGHRITCSTLVNVREKPGLLDLSDMMNPKSKSRWGNKFGIFLVPIDCHKASTNPLEYLKTANATLRRKKRSVEGFFTYKITNLAVSLLGPKCGTRLAYKMLSNTTLTVSNMMGPREELAVAGNRVTYLKGSISSIPQTLGMHMLSYGGKANLQILAATDVITDPEYLAKCFENALLELKQAVLSKEVATK